MDCQRGLYEHTVDNLNRDDVRRVLTNGWPTGRDEHRNHAQFDDITHLGSDDPGGLVALEPKRLRYN